MRESVMKKFLHQTTLLIGMSVFFAATSTGCNRITPEKLLSDAMKNQQKVTSLAADISLDMTMGVSQNDLDMSLDVAMDMDLEAIKDPQAYHMKAEVDLGSLGGKNTLELFAKENKAGTKVTTYTSANGEWTKSEEKAEDEPTDEITDLDHFHSDDLILEKKTKEVNGKEAYSIKSTVSGKDLEESGLLDLVGNEDLGLDFSETEADVTLMIYKEEKLPAYVSIEFKNKAEDSTKSDEDVQMFLSSMKCEITYKDYNQVKKITVPNEALHARNDISESSTEDVIDAIGSNEASEPLPEDDPTKIQKDKDGNYILLEFTGKKEFSVKPPEDFKLDTEMSSPTSLSFDYEESSDIDGHRVSLHYAAYELSDRHTEQENIDYIKEQADSLSKSEIEFFNIKTQDAKEVKAKDKNFKYSLLTYSYDEADDVRELECEAWFVTEDGFILSCSISETIYGKYDFMATEKGLIDLMNNISE